MKLEIKKTSSLNKQPKYLSIRVGIKFKFNKLLQETGSLFKGLTSP